MKWSLVRIAAGLPFAVCVALTADTLAEGFALIATATFAMAAIHISLRTITDPGKPA